MKYSDLIESHLKYGTTKEDIINNKGFEKVLENVIVAPWWSHSIFENKNLKIEKINDKLYNMYGDNFSFSFIELKLIGASSIMEAILPLGLATIPFCIVGMFGDLFASVIKRSVDLKDYGKLIPGHGGILDRFDSILLIAPVLSLFVNGGLF